ncbi:MAG: hypothetical protein BGO70_06800 [Bacteroidetes bacterium 43-93]|nr:hypothetical protein [Bacteroidota bacterium]OJW97490.1 MAG: hypothetical protein BGO70_06800 [Bacteroidetes bacterium 43-93]
MTNVEQKELRGITLKLVWTIILSAIACVSVGVRLYLNVMIAIQENKAEYRMQGQRLDYVEREVAKNADDIEILKYKLQK